jgi:RimJ/RimL family protein N-acetyltransferase
MAAVFDLENEASTTDRANFIASAPSVEEGRKVASYVGERIYFRPLEQADALLLQRWINDPENWHTLGGRVPPLDLRQEQEWIQSVGHDRSHCVFGIVLKDNDQLIGNVHLRNIEPIGRQAELGIMVGDYDYKDRGLGTEAVRLMVRFAFKELNLRRVSLFVLSNNPRAIRTYQKAGFVQEGCAREAAYSDGAFHHVYSFGLLRWEWTDDDTLAEYDPTLEL